MSGFLEVGVDLHNEVVINLPADFERPGHVTFSPDQARNLAELLIRKAAEAEGQAVDGRPIRGAEGDRSLLADALMSVLGYLQTEGFRLPPNVYARLNYWASRQIELKGNHALADPVQDLEAVLPIFDLLAGVPR